MTSPTQSRDMAGEPSAVSLTCFGAHIDALARKTAGCPDAAVVHTIEGVGEGDNKFVILSASVPSGTRKNGPPSFNGVKTPHHKAVVSLADYRAIFSGESE